ncbi:MAG: hypothetical protein ACQEXO_09405 [Pseudomonadota bacterium]
MSQLKNELAPALLPAVISALIVCVLRFFTIPWSIWKGATLRLADMRKRDEAEVLASSRSEFPVFDWLRTAWDGLIFLSWFIGALVGLMTFFTVAFSFSGSIVGGFSAMIGVLITTYFAVIAMSLVKESLIIILSIALNIEKISSKNKT